jgi:asparagine synthase (glutamine-hydrolysing)
MCGIAGLFAYAGGELPPEETSARLARMVATLRHRGPDELGIDLGNLKGGFALGHARLSIIDRAGGRQPLLSEDRQIAVVVNGEIYNHRELRADLEKKGHRFRSDSDSEIVAHLYEEVGARVPELLRGMFAFALWDARRGSLLLARDRFGEKPLYYSFRPDGLVFASELGALLADEGTRATLSTAALDAYLACAARSRRRSSCDSCPTSRWGRSCRAASIRRSSSPAWRARPAPR